MRKYRVNVNGTAYEVEIEEITGSVPSAPAAAPVAAPAAPAAAPAAESELISSPMPGVILSVSFSAGDKVKRGDVLMVLEAMKMENEIMCPRDGTLLSVYVGKGATVETGTHLCVIG